MYGLINKLQAVSGQRNTLAEILVNASTGLTGCLSYVVALDAADADALWVMEAWESRADHEASLKVHRVVQAIERGRPLVAAFAERHGHGLGQAEAH
jgi:quinol monooxygenase YgiN